MKSKIIGTGSFLPSVEKNNETFLANMFLEVDGKKQSRSTSKIMDRFESITEIKSRKYACDCYIASSMAIKAAERAITSAKIDKESIDYIIVANVWGDIESGQNFSQTMPNLAAKVKGGLGISNRSCVAYDVVFGCTGWIEAFIQANRLIIHGEATNVLVIGSDTTSRIVDPTDIDSLLFGDGAGAIILSRTNASNSGLLSHKTYSHCQEELDYLQMGRSHNPYDKGIYLKMQGRNVFKYACNEMPKLIYECLENARYHIDDVKYFFFHQANAKMLHKIAKDLYSLYGGAEVNMDKIPMNLQTYGNTSVASIPILLDEVTRQEELQSGDLIVLASVGAGMHVNAIVLQF